MAAVFTFCYQQVPCSIYSVTSLQELNTFQCNSLPSSCTRKLVTYRLCRTKLATKIQSLDATGLLKLFYQEMSKTTTHPSA